MTHSFLNVAGVIEKKHITVKKKQQLDENMSNDNKAVNTTSFAILRWRSLAFLLLASSTNVKSYSTQLPYPNVPAMINQHLIPENSQRIVSKDIRSNQERHVVSYDLGVGKNKPVIRKESSLPSNRGAQSKNIEEMTAFLLEHKASNDILSEKEWLHRLQIERERQHTEEQRHVPKQSKQQLPSVVLSRFTDNAEITILDQQPPTDSNNIHNNNGPTAQAYAQQLITSQYDLNTPWIEILIHHEQQRIKNMKLGTASA